MKFLDRFFKKEPPKKPEVFVLNEFDRWIGLEFKECVIVVNGELRSMMVQIDGCIFKDVTFIEVSKDRVIRTSDNLTEFLYI